MSNERDFAVQLLHLQAELALEHGLNISERSVLIVGEIDERQFALVDAKLALLEAQSRAAITLRINSAGGNPYDALAIVGRMERSKCQIITEGYGHIMSAAGLILAAGNKRRMHKLAWFMTHESSYALEGKHVEIKSAVQQSEREEKQWCEAMAHYTHKSAYYWQLLNSGNDKFLTAPECLEAGVVDEVF